MKIIYSKYTFEEVHNTRRKWLSDEPGTSHEKIKIVLRSFPFLVYFLFCEYILLKYTLLINIFDYSQPLAYRNVMRKIMNLDIYKNAGVYTKFSIDILSYICYMSAIGIALCLIAILICKIYKNIVCRIIPISTPCIDRNKKNQMRILEITFLNQVTLIVSWRDRLTTPDNAGDFFLDILLNK